MKRLWTLTKDYPWLAGIVAGMAVYQGAYCWFQWSRLPVSGYRFGSDPADWWLLIAVAVTVALMIRPPSWETLKLAGKSTLLAAFGVTLVWFAVLLGYWLTGGAW